MVDLQYRIGGLEIGSYGLDYNHGFVVTVKGDVAAIYVAENKRHADIAEHFGLGSFNECSEFVPQKDLKFVGGGICYKERDKLVLDEFSADFGAIPKHAAREFGNLMVSELKNRGIVLNGVVAKPYKSSMNKFWKELGF